ASEPDRVRSVDESPDGYLTFLYPVRLATIPSQTSAAIIITNAYRHRCWRSSCSVASTRACDAPASLRRVTADWNSSAEMRPGSPSCGSTLIATRRVAERWFAFVPRSAFGASATVAIPGVRGRPAGASPTTYSVVCGRALPRYRTASWTNATKVG